eukprot:GHUV01000760.1.p1 GENE.GHUV01000760.1~~GHUV01000760.1.p1  ORF type:complete len:218 (+),score=35.21 GHUV01000760.1:224-877(+)
MVVSVVCLAVMALVSLQLANAQGQWHTGRATFYGKDGWSIHTGSCGYGYLDENAGTGWDVAALADAAWDYSNSCGKCKEVKCKNMWFKDGYGQQLDRSNVCFDQAASVVVTIVDTCPCSYPGNYYSNKRWCCGDMYHMDISLWSYEKLAPTDKGVIAIEWRDVPCWYKPNKNAKNPWGQKSGPDRGPPGGWYPALDKRPYKALSWQSSGRKLRGFSQ